MIHIECTHTVCVSLKTYPEQLGSLGVSGPFHVFGNLQKLVKILPRGTQVLPTVQVTGRIVRTPRTGSHLPIVIVHVIGHSVVRSHLCERPVVGVLTQRIAYVGMSQQTDRPRRHVFQIRRFFEVFHCRLEQVVASRECHQECR